MTVVSTPPPADVPTTAQIIASFVRSITGVFGTMVSAKVQIGKPALKQDPPPMYDVSGVIGLSGLYVGSMVLSLQKATAEALASSFAGMTITADSPDFADAIGELANMIAGSAKTSFGEGTNISTPSIVMGRGHTIARLHDVPCIVIPCSTEHGNFSVEVNLKAPAAGRVNGGIR